MTVVEDRPIMSLKYCLPVALFYFWRKVERPRQRGLSAIAEHLVNQPSEPGRHNVEMHVSAITAFTHLYTYDLDL